MHVIRHPLAQSAVTRLRDVATSGKDFRSEMRTLSRILTIEATRDLQPEDISVRTPLDITTEGKELRENIVVIPVLRAGLGMLNGFLDMIPNASVGFVGIRRDEETLQAEEYYANLPPLENTSIFLLDPMLATGGSVVAAIESLTLFSTSNIRLLSILAAPEGIEYVTSKYDSLTLYTTAIDERLDERGFIVPGLGDAGDRLWATK